MEKKLLANNIEGICFVKKSSNSSLNGLGTEGRNLKYRIHKRSKLYKTEKLKRPNIKKIKAEFS